MRLENEGVIVGPADGKDLANPIGGGWSSRSETGTPQAPTLSTTMPPPPVSAGPRIHRRHEEAFYVLAGELSVQVGPRTIAAPVALRSGAVGGSPPAL